MHRGELGSPVYAANIHTQHHFCQTEKDATGRAKKQVRCRNSSPNPMIDKGTARLGRARCVVGYNPM